MTSGHAYRPLPSVRPRSSPASVAISPDHRVVAWGDLTGAVTAALLTDGHVLWRRQLDRAPAGGTAGGVLILSYSPDGRTLAASVSHVGTELVPATGAGGTRILHAADNNATALAFAPDGRHLVTGDSDGSARLWDLDTRSGIDLGTAGSPASSRTIYGAAYDAGGDTVAVWAFDGSVRLWDAQTGDPVGPSLTAPQSGAPSRAAGPTTGRFSPCRRMMSSDVSLSPSEP
jgi:WD40 repeat protein